ncbi:MAG: riboflavin synthase, partial [Pseudomonadota bacterium]|nr:riboflavin synthase [Pseudomonadota bacterium]
MFTGIVQDVGEIESLEPRSGDLVIGIRPGALDTKLVKLGDSIAVAGVCLTAVSIASGCV